jgi:hypothetical protein
MRLHLIVIASIVSTSLTAQEIPGEPVAGQRVRIRVETGDRVVGKLAEVRGDTLLIQEDGVWFAPRTRVPMSSVHRIEVSRGRYISGRNLTVGILAGVAFGFFTLLIVEDQMQNVCIFGDCSDPSGDVANAVLLGAGAGLVLGLTKRADRWAEVPAHPVRVGLVPSASGVGVKISVVMW